MDVDVISNQTFFNREVNESIIYVIIFENDLTKILKANQFSFPEEDDNVLSDRVCDNFFKITEDILKVVVVAKNVKKYMIDYIKTISSDVSVFEYDGILSKGVSPKGLNIRLEEAVSPAKRKLTSPTCFG